MIATIYERNISLAYAAKCVTFPRIGTVRSSFFSRGRHFMRSVLDYATWVNDNREYLETFSDKRVFVTYAGGKDASAILHFLIQARKDFGFEFETHAAMFPTHVYTDGEVRKLDSYWKARDVHITWHPVPGDESAFDVAKQKGTNPCEVCHAAKRKSFLEYLNQTTTDWHSLVIIVGWSLWDVVGYSLEYLFGSVYSDANGLFQGKSIEESHSFWINNYI